MEENFSPRQSLELIESMINKTKANISENRFYFLLWGWIAFTGIMGQFILKVLLQYKHHYVVWFIVFVGVAITLIHSNKKGRQKRVRTYLGENMGNLWTGMGVSFFVLGFIISNLGVQGTGWLISYPFYILLYGLGTFVSGRMLQFKPLVVGGIINWVLACVSVFFSFDYQMLFAAAAIVASYLVPGYLLKPNRS
jgi:hypothetical protein